MKSLYLVLFSAFLLIIQVQDAAARGTIERACMRSDRTASRDLCQCIQRVADQTLTRSDQRKGAKFFAKPHKAQEIRQSDNASNEAFWKKWKAFGNTAEAICG